MLCSEIFALQNKFNLMLPFLTEVEVWHNRRYGTDELERHFGIPIIQPSADVVEKYTDKALFGEFMRTHGLAPFTPTIYQSKFEVVYPCLLKFTKGLFGKGINLVNNLTEMEAVIAGQNLGTEYILQESVVGRIEPIIHFVARSGRILGASCVLDRAQSSALFVTGQQRNLKPTDTVSCRALEEISPLLDVVRQIIKLTKYNGLGCFNFKYAARKMTQKQLDKFLQGIPTLDNSDEDSITTDFGSDDARQFFSKYPATPKIFDFNTRHCGSHIRHQTEEFYRMIRMYLEEVANE